VQQADDGLPVLLPWDEEFNGRVGNNDHVGILNVEGPAVGQMQAQQRAGSPPEK
jgi:hypothetical protein